MSCVQPWSSHGDLWWRNFVSFSSKLGWGVREREEEMRKDQVGLEEILV
jgi:hypothetical protein